MTAMTAIKATLCEILVATVGLLTATTLAPDTFVAFWIGFLTGGLHSWVGHWWNARASEEAISFCLKPSTVTRLKEVAAARRFSLSQAFHIALNDFIEKYGNDTDRKTP